jgi:diguanylate cyclase (GGDEF)-like protein
MAGSDTSTFKRLISVGLALSAERNIVNLMERILLEAKIMVNADAGTLYIRTPDNQLKFEILLNDTLDIVQGGNSGYEIPLPPVRMYLDDETPNTKNVASCAAVTGNTIIIDDAYETDEFDFSGTKEFDRFTGYRSKSFLTVPLKNHQDEVMAVLQLLNAKDPQSGEVVPFPAKMQPLIEALTSQASIALENTNLLQEQRELRNQLEIKVQERTLELKTALQKLSRAHDMLKELTTIDAVTGIKNRQFFDQAYAVEWKRAARQRYPISLLLLDLDHFKSVNDTHGHLAGDECLHVIASGISSKLKRPADILARYGGEEFVIILPHTYNSNAYLLAEQIRSHIETLPVISDGTEIHVTISIGVATITPHQDNNRKELIAAADAGLYEAKGVGRNKVCIRKL